jgi:glycosyltransferase involved in cell wall biosynthesis
VLRHPVNLGQGAALQTGITYALRRGADLVVTFDADGQHRVADIPLLIGRLDEAGAEVCFGSRFLGQAVGIPRTRRLLLKAAVWFTYFTSGVKLTDAHNGLRLFTRAAAASLRIRQNRMAHASEIVEQVGRAGLPITEAPVTILYSAYSLQKGQRLSNSLSIVGDLLMDRIRR